MKVRSVLLCTSAKLLLSVINYGGVCYNFGVSVNRGSTVYYSVRPCAQNSNLCCMSKIPL